MYLKAVDSLLRGCLVSISFLLSTAGFAASAEHSAIIGKNEWLFYGLEIGSSAALPATDVSINLIQRLSKVLSANGIALSVAMVPIKMRVYSEHLPEEVQLSPYTRENYERVLNALRGGGVHAVDLNSAFLASPLRSSDTPLFFRLDTHWSSTGALQAADAIKQELLSSPTMRTLLESMPEASYKLSLGKIKRPSKGRDLLQLLPSDSPAVKFAFDYFYQVNVSRVNSHSSDLLGKQITPAVGLVGSSYSQSWTGFTDGLRFSLQRDIFSVTAVATQGAWYGMESFLSDDGFQNSPQKLILWEMPERDMHATPDLQFRDPIYKRNNTDWLLKVSALVQRTCLPSKKSWKFASSGLGKRLGKSHSGEFVLGATNDNDYLEIIFSNQTSILEYFSAKFTAIGSKSITVEAIGPAGSQKWTTVSNGDDQSHNLKLPAVANSEGSVRVRIYPGKTTSFAIKDVQICSQPDDLLN
jgi:alginate O-acetyltransferase complex protein AlgJ